MWRLPQSAGGVLQAGGISRAFSVAPSEGVPPWLLGPRYQHPRHQSAAPQRRSGQGAVWTRGGAASSVVQTPGISEPGWPAVPTPRCPFGALVVLSPYQSRLLEIQFCEKEAFVKVCLIASPPFSSGYFCWKAANVGSWALSIWVPPRPQRGTSAHPCPLTPGRAPGTRNLNRTFLCLSGAFLPSGRGWDPRRPGSKGWQMEQSAVPP